MAKRTETIRYIHNLTPDEQAALYASLSDALSEYERLDDERKTIAGEMTARLKSLRAEMEHTNRRVRDGYEERLGECSITRDVRAQKVYYHLLETGEMVKERDFEGSDYQLALDDGLYDGDEKQDDDDPQPA